MDNLFKSSICKLTCCNNKPTKHCSRCKFARYCSKECQIEHWKYHKQHCFIGYSKTFIYVEEKELKNIIKNNGVVIFGNEREYEENIIKRIDGNYYTIFSGIRIVDSFNKTLEQSYKYFRKRIIGRIWNDLYRKYGEPYYVGKTLYSFLDKKRKNLIILDKRTDDVIQEIDLTPYEGLRDDVNVVPILTLDRGILIRIEAKQTII